MTDQINITYTPATGDLLFTTARQTSGLDEAIKAIGDFIRTLKEPVKPTPKQVQQPAEVKTASKPRPEKKTAKDGRRLWTDEEKAEIIRRYQAGEGPKAIGDSLGVNRNTIQQIIHAAGVTEGRTGQNLRKKQPEPEPQSEADDNEPV
jgi:transposase-like protein